MLRALKTFVVASAVSGLPLGAWAQYTTFQGSTYTTHLERTVHFLTNALRTSPTEYLRTWSNAGFSNCANGAAPVQTLMWQKGLTDAARFHCNSMSRSQGS